MMADAVSPRVQPPMDDQYDVMADVIQNLKCRRVLKEHTMSIISFDFCEQGTFALTSSEDETLVIYDVLQAK
jgi:WD40 repeat protein